MKRWEDWVTLVVGVWLFLSPWILGYSDIGAAAWNSWIVGLGFIGFAAWALTMPKPWEEWTIAVLSLWLVFSPWLLDFTTIAAASWNAVLFGVITLVISLEATRGARQPHMPAAS